MDSIAENLKCHYVVIDNIEEGPNVYTAKISFTNTGQNTIDRGLWSIYFTHLKMIDTSRVDITNHSGLKISHINGYLFNIEPVENFQGFIPNQTISIKIWVEGVSVSKTDVLPNWYVASNNAKPMIVRSTKGEDLNFVGAFDNSSKWKRFRWDRYDPYSASVRYDMNNDTDDMKRAPLVVIPTPKQIYVNDAKTVNLSKDWKIVAEYSLINEARFLGGKIDSIFEYY